MARNSTSPSTPPSAAVFVEQVTDLRSNNVTEIANVVRPLPATYNTVGMQGFAIAQQDPTLNGGQGGIRCSYSLSGGPMASSADDLEFRNPERDASGAIVKMHYLSITLK